MKNQPKPVNTHFNLGKDFFPLLREAEKLLKENLSLFKDDKDTLLNLANLYLIAGEFDKAEETYNLIGSNPNDKTIALNGLALVKHLKGKETGLRYKCA